MNITEISVTNRVLVSREPKVKEVATVKGFTTKGEVIIRDCSGQIIIVHPQQKIKKF